MQYYAPHANVPPSAVPENNADATENGNAGNGMHKANDGMAEENGDAVMRNKMEEDTIDTMQEENKMDGKNPEANDMAMEEKTVDGDDDPKNKMEEGNTEAKNKMEEGNTEAKDKMEEENDVAKNNMEE